MRAPRYLVHMSARSAGQRHVCAVHPLHGAYVGEFCLQAIPACRQYLAVQAGFRRHVPAGFFNRAPGRTGLAHFVEFLDKHRACPVRDPSAGLVLPVHSSVCPLALRPLRKRLLCRVPAARLKAPAIGRCLFAMRAADGRNRPSAERKTRLSKAPIIRRQVPVGTGRSGERR